MGQASLQCNKEARKRSEQEVIVSKRREETKKEGGNSFLVRFAEAGVARVARTYDVVIGSRYPLFLLLALPGGKRRKIEESTTSNG